MIEVPSPHGRHRPATGAEARQLTRQSAIAGLARRVLGRLGRQPRTCFLRARHLVSTTPALSLRIAAARRWRPGACVLRSRAARRRSTILLELAGRPAPRRARHPRALARSRSIAAARPLAVDRVMTEGSLLRPRARRAGHQAGARRPDRGHLPAARLPHHAAALRRYAEPLDTGGDGWSSGASPPTFKDVPGGQVLGPTYDYTHRLLDFDAAWPRTRPSPRRRRRPTPTRAAARQPTSSARGPDRAAAGRRRRTPGDLTREPLSLPADRDLRLQNLARGDEGFLLALGYSTQRGYGNTHPFVGEIRPTATCAVELRARRAGLRDRDRPRSTSPSARWSTSSRARQTCRRSSPAATASPSATPSARRWPWRWSTARCAPGSLARTATAPAQDEEFVLSHSDNVEASGFVAAPEAAALRRFPVRAGGLVRTLRAEVEAVARGEPSQAAEEAMPENSAKDAARTTTPTSTSRPSG